MHDSLRAPSEIQDAFASVGAIHDSFEELTEMVAVKRTLTADNPPSGKYVGVRPALNGTTSAYVNAHFVDVSLDPERARSVARTRDWKLLRSNSVTGRVRVPASAVADPETFDRGVMSRGTAFGAQPWELLRTASARTKASGEAMPQHVTRRACSLLFWAGPGDPRSYCRPVTGSSVAILVHRERHGRCRSCTAGCQ